MVRTHWKGNPPLSKSSPKWAFCAMSCEKMVILRIWRKLLCIYIHIYTTFSSIPPIFQLCAYSCHQRIFQILGGGETRDTLREDGPKPAAGTSVMWYLPNRKVEVSIWSADCWHQSSYSTFWQKSLKCNKLFQGTSLLLDCALCFLFGNENSTKPSTVDGSEIQTTTWDVKKPCK